MSKKIINFYFTILYFYYTVKKALNKMLLINKRRLANLELEVEESEEVNITLTTKYECRIF